uniref:Uncharacterized protein n=1 Tax=Romanomermis culicivorax TaxID=13658 RepID=A0A915JZ09_ROMCU
MQSGPGRICCLGSESDDRSFLDPDPDPSLVFPEPESIGDCRVVIDCHRCSPTVTDCNRLNPRNRIADCRQLSPIESYNSATVDDVTYK